VVIADDQALFREGLRTLLSAHASINVAWRIGRFESSLWANADALYLPQHG
jgi:DNA-binding NarL/FixJ family response regulator